MTTLHKNLKHLASPRSQDDISKICIYTELLGRAGWTVDIRYKDGKAASLSVDYSPHRDMIELCANAVKKQLEDSYAAL